MRILSALLLFASSAVAANWSSGGPYTGPMPALSASESDPRVMYAGNSGGVFRSDDGGVTWRDVSRGLRDVSFVAADPRRTNIAYMIAAGRVYKTVDGAATWDDTTNGLPASRPSAMLIDPGNPDNLYVGGRCGVIFKTAHPEWHEAAGVFKSTDGGRTWQQAMRGLQGFALCIEELSLDPATPAHLFSTAIYGEGGQSQTFDGGLTWERARALVPARGIVAHPRLVLTRYGITGFVGVSRPSILVSDDGGFTWRATAREGLPINPYSFILYDLAVDPVSAWLFLATSLGLYRSGDGGENWAPVSGAPRVPTYRVVFDPADSRVVLASAQGIFYLQAPGAAAPSRAKTFDLANNVASIAIDPNDPRTVYAATLDAYVTGQYYGRVFRSRDAGSSWELLPDDDPRGHRALTVDAAGDLYAAGFYGISKLARGSDRWIHDFPGGLEYYLTIAADPHVSGVVYAGGLNRTVVTRDGGATWRQLSLRSADQMVIDPVETRRLYAAAGGVLSVSNDGGETWHTTHLEPAWFIAVSPSRPSVLYRVGRYTERVGTEFIDIYSALFRSEDYGASWRMLRHPLDSDYGLMLAVDPRDEKVVYMTSPNRGVFRSTDGGATWNPLNAGLPTTSATSPVIDQTGRFLYVGTSTASTWQLSLQPRGRRVRR